MVNVLIATALNDGRVSTHEGIVSTLYGDQCWTMNSVGYFTLTCTPFTITATRVHPRLIYTRT